MLFKKVMITKLQWNEVMRNSKPVQLTGVNGTALHCSKGKQTYLGSELLSGMV